MGSHLRENCMQSLPSYKCHARYSLSMYFLTVSKVPQYMLLAQCLGPQHTYSFTDAARQFLLKSLLWVKMTQKACIS